VGGEQDGEHQSILAQHGGRGVLEWETGWGNRSPTAWRSGSVWSGNQEEGMTSTTACGDVRCSR
jgi:hypothetical protein